MRFIWRYLRKFKGTFALVLVLAAINQIFSLLDPQILRLLTDRYATKAGELAQSEFARGIVILLLAFVGVALVSRIAKNFQDYFVNAVTQKLGTRMYADSVQHAFALPYASFEDQRSGELLEKLQKARLDTQELIKNAVAILFVSLIGVIFVTIYAFTVHWSIGLVYGLAVPFLGTATYFISRGIRGAQQRVVAQTTSLAGSTTETLRNVELVKSLGLEAQEVARLNAVNEKILTYELRKIILIRQLSFIQGTIVNALRAGLMGLMLWLIFAGGITLGEFLSLFIYSFFIFSPMAELAQVATSYQEASASVSQLEDVLKTQPERTPEHPKNVGALQTIDFKDVTFQHQSAEHPALANISLRIRAGETIAFVGPTGSGKTTLMKLLVGLYRPTQGSVCYNDVCLNDLDLKALRTRIGLVAQETQLFAGTIRENLQFVRPAATDDECLAVLKAAAATSLLGRAADGLGTKIGEGGLKLSGGEKQRLAIARALLRQPDLIIFDEATSSLDSITEKAITETIQQIVRQNPQLTTVLVAHRLSTVAHADRIFVLERGRIIEQGSHDELNAQRGLYFALWREQSAANGTIR